MVLQLKFALLLVKCYSSSLMGLRRIFKHPAMVGGVLSSEAGSPIAFFSEIIPNKLLNRLIS